MPAQARLEATLTGNDAPFVAAVNRAEARAKTFAGRVENLLQFRGERRVARGGGLLGQQLLQAQSGMDALEASAYGIASIFKVGFGATVGVIAGIAVFKKLQEQIDAATKADVALRGELAKPLSLQGGLGPEGIGAQYEAITKATDALIEKHDTFGSKFRQYLPFLLNPSMAGMGGTQGSRDYSRESKDILAGRQREKDLSSARANAEIRIVEARRMGLEDSEREAAIQEQSIKTAEKRSKLFLDRGLTKPGRSALDLAKSDAAIKSDEKLSLEQVAKKFDLKKQEEEVENRLLNLHSSSLTKDQQSLVGLRERINLLKQRLSGPGSDEEKTRIGTQLHGLENQELNARYQEYLKPESQKQAERRSQEAYQRWVKDDARRMGLDNPHFDTQNRLIGGTDPMTRRHVEINPFQPPSYSATVSGPSSGSGTDAALVPLIQQLLTAFKDAWEK